jgi:hemerythrin superfamily protein
MVEASRFRESRELKKAEVPIDVKESFSSSQGPDGLKLLKEDHKMVFDLYDNQLCKIDNLSKKREIMDQIITELSKHSNIEEQILYPVLRWSLDEGERLYQESIKDHQELKNK